MAFISSKEGEQRVHEFCMSAVCSFLFSDSDLRYVVMVSCCFRMASYSFVLFLLMTWNIVIIGLEVNIEFGLLWPVTGLKRSGFDVGWKLDAGCAIVWRTVGVGPGW